MGEVTMFTKTKKIVLMAVLILITINLALAATRTFYVTEGDFIRIDVEALDPDRDQTITAFSLPLDQDGEWQTSLGDAGVYLINITVSDGQEETIEQIKLVVEKMNRAPHLLENIIIVKETQLINLREFIEDPEDDPLEFKFNFPFDEGGVWQTTFGDAKTFVTTFSVNDGVNEAQKRVEIQVLKTNRPPTIVETFVNERKVHIDEGETLNFFVKATDVESGKVEFTWFLDEEKIASENEGDYYFNFESSGEHTLQVVVSDGEGQTQQDWLIVVQNINRKPELLLSSLTLNEGELAQLVLPEHDLDGDELTFSYDHLFVNGVWQTTFNDAGEYEVEVTAFDGELESTTIIEVTVLDVDREPALTLPKKLSVAEGEELVWNIVAFDPDGDELSITIEGLPEEAQLREQTLIWEPDFDTIVRKGGFLSDVLNILRLEHYFLNKREFELVIEVCGKELCTQGNVNLVLFNTNLAPELKDFDDIIIVETQKLSLGAEAVDPDNDIITYLYGWPLDKKGEWQTDFGDHDKYEVEVKASDGSLEDSILVEVIVEKNNRVPELTIKDDDVTVNEGQLFQIKVSASDKDGDELEIVLANPPLGATFSEGNFRWKAPYSTVVNKTDNWLANLVSDVAYLNKKFNHESSVVWLEFVGSDGDAEVIHPVKITVKNVNQAPEIVNVVPEDVIQVLRNEPVVLSFLAQDSDNDELSYRWHFGALEADIAGTNTIERVYVTPGVKKIKVVVSDGRDTVEHSWIIEVLDEELLMPVDVPVLPVEPYTYKVYFIEH